jgi:hypothetical protein
MSDDLQRLLYTTCGITPDTSPSATAFEMCDYIDRGFLDGSGGSDGTAAKVGYVFNSLLSSFIESAAPSGLSQAPACPTSGVTASAFKPLPTLYVCPKPDAGESGSVCSSFCPTTPIGSWAPEVSTFCRGLVNELNPPTRSEVGRCMSAKIPVGNGLAILRQFCQVHSCPCEAPAEVPL